MVLLGESFAEIFHGNCLALGIPCGVLEHAAIEALMTQIEQSPELEVSVDLGKREVRAGDACYALGMPEAVRAAFVEGRWDSTAELVAGGAEVARVVSQIPYLSGFGS